MPLSSVRSPVLTLLTAALTVISGCATSPEPAAQESPTTIVITPGLPPPPKAPTTVAPPRGTRKERMERAAEKAADRPTERTIDKPAPAERPVVKDAILFDCIVRLPDDPTENRELCRSFRMTIEDADGTEVARFRFGLDGSYRFAAQPGVKYRLKTSTGKNWTVTIDPSRDLAMGDRVLVELKQNQ